VLQFTCGALHCSRSSSARDSPITPHSVRPLRQLEVVTVRSFCVAFECCSFFGSDFEVTNGHGVEKKEVNGK
jgi:hypothetical protein